MYDLKCAQASTAIRAEASPGNFVCSWRHDGTNAARVDVAGEVDIATAPDLERTLLAAEARGRVVVLDLRELDFIDSSGVHVIITAHHRARQRGCRLALVRGPECVDRVFTLTGASEKLEIGDLDRISPPSDG
jgi:anti-sigma B factor antagonist